jgi:hypothetical protein
VCSACGGGYGIYSFYGGMILQANTALTSFTVSGNSGYGINVSGFTLALHTTCNVVVCGNVSRGVGASEQSKITLQQASVSGHGSDYYADNMSYINATGFLYPSSTFSPAANTVGNEQAYINT